MSVYPELLAIHVACVVSSVSLFILRGALQWSESPVSHSKLLRVAPHLIDTILLASAVGLCVVLRQYPFEAAWLTAKVLGVIAYIGLGMLALRHHHPRVRLGAFVAALLTVAYIVAVALTKSAWPLAGR